MSKVSQKKKLKEEQLFKHAFDLFTSKGFNDTSISDIVDKAGVAKGTFYLYFKSKYDIRNRLIANKVQDICEKAYTLIEDIDTLSTEDKLISFFNNIIDILTENTLLLKFISKNFNYGIIYNYVFSENTTEENGNISDGSGFDISALYSNYISNTESEYRNPEMMIYMIIELINGTCYNSILEHRPVDINTLKPELISAIRAIIRSQAIV